MNFLGKSENTMKYIDNDVLVNSKKKYCLTYELVNIILMINYYLMLFRSFFINQIKNGTNKHLFGTCKMISSFNSKIEKIYCFPLEM